MHKFFKKNIYQVLICFAFIMSLSENIFCIDQNSSGVQDFLVVGFDNTIVRISGELYLNNEPFTEYTMEGLSQNIKFKAGEILFLEPVFNRITKVTKENFKIQEQLKGCLIKSGDKSYLLSHAKAVAFLSRLKDEKDFTRQYAQAKKSESVTGTGTLTAAVFTGKEFLHPVITLPWSESVTLKALNFEGIVSLAEIAYMIPAAYLVKLKNGYTIHYNDIKTFESIPNWESSRNVIFIMHPGMESTVQDEYQRILSSANPENPQYYDRITDSAMKSALLYYKRHELIYIEKLDLSNKQLSKIQGMAGLYNMASLDLSRNQLTVIEGLDDLPALTWLGLSFNQITKIQGLDNLTNLVFLNLNNNQILKIEGLDKLSMLSWLSLSTNQISKIEGLDNLSKLSLINLSINTISKVQGLDKLINLKELNLGSNKLTKLEGLDKLFNLTTLWLFNNKLTKLEGMDNLGKLSVLGLSSNKLSTLAGMEKLTNLVSVDLFYNQITKLEGIENLSSLTVLNLNDNKLSNLSGLDKPANLKELFIGNNAAIMECGPMKKLKNLEKLYIQGTSITADSMADWEFTNTLAIRNAAYGTMYYIKPGEKADYYIEKGEVKKQ